jgi:hypothetical protein
VCVMPALVLRTSAVTDAIRFQDRAYNSRPGTDSYLQQLLQTREIGPLVLFAGILGLGLLLRSRRARPVVLAYLAFAIPTLAALMRPAFQPVRNILPLIPFLAIGAATAIVEIVRFAGTRLRVPHQLQTAGAVLIVLALCWSPFQRGTRTYINAKRSHTDTRTTLRRWIAARVQPDDRVLVSEELAFLPDQLSRICAHVVVQSQRRPAPVDRYDWVIVGDLDGPNWPPLWMDALAPQPEARSIGIYRTSGEDWGLRIKTQPLEDVWHWNLERIHVFGPDDALTRRRRQGPCPLRDRAVRQASGDDLSVVEPGRG